MKGNGDKGIRDKNNNEVDERNIMKIEDWLLGTNILWKDREWFDERKIRSGILKRNKRLLLFQWKISTFRIRL